MPSHVLAVSAVYVRCDAGACGMYRDAMCLDLMPDRTRVTAQKSGVEVWVRREVAALRRKRELVGCPGTQ